MFIDYKLIYFQLISQGYTRQSALKLIDEYVDSCINIHFLIKSKMKK